MKEMTADDESERFRTGAAKYAAYLETPEGRLRLDLAFTNLQDFLPQSSRSLLALDLGCGTGAIAMRLARLGFHVTLLDASVPMLDFAERAALKAARMPGHAAPETESTLTTSIRVKALWESCRAIGQENPARWGQWEWSDPQIKAGA